eukprot:gene8754-27_t
MHHVVTLVVTLIDRLDTSALQDLFLSSKAVGCQLLFSVGVAFERCCCVDLLRAAQTLDLANTLVQIRLSLTHALNNLVPILMTAESQCPLISAEVFAAEADQNLPAKFMFTLLHGVSSTLTVYSLEPALPSFPQGHARAAVAVLSLIHILLVSRKSGVGAPITPTSSSALIRRVDVLRGDLLKICTTLIPCAMPQLQSASAMMCLPDVVRDIRTVLDIT